MNALSIYFAAGCFGGLINGLFVWLCGKYGLTGLMGVNLAPDISAPWMYQRLVWGGLWGFLFFLPVLSDSVVRRGLLAAIFPSLVMLAVVFPMQMGVPAWGLELGRLTPLFVYIANAVWGVSAALWARLAMDRPRGLRSL